MPKATQAQKQERLRKIYTLLSINSSYMDIVEYCEQNWQIKRTQVSKYIKEVTDQIKIGTIEKMAEIRSTALMQYQNLFKRVFSNRPPAPPTPETTEEAELQAKLALIPPSQFEYLTMREKIDLLIKIRARMDKISGIEVFKIAETDPDGEDVDWAHLPSDKQQKRLEEVCARLGVEVPKEPE